MNTRHRPSGARSRSPHRCAEGTSLGELAAAIEALSGRAFRYQLGQLLDGYGPQRHDANLASRLRVVDADALLAGTDGSG